MSEPEIPELNPIYKILIMVLPIGVVVGTTIFMYMYFHMEREDEKIQTVIVSRQMKVDVLEDLVGKFTDRIGIRDIDTEQGRNGLLRAASMIEGSLGPQNLGLTVKKGEGEAAHDLLWKALSVDILGQSKPDEVVIATVSFTGEGDVADANTVSTMMMLASSMAREKPARTIRFVFLPLDKSDSEYLKKRASMSIQSGEELAAFIAIDTMKVEPSITDDEWLSLNSDKKFNLNSMMNEKTLFLTHPVYSPITWKGDRDGRLTRTMTAAQDIRAWLLAAAN